MGHRRSGPRKIFSDRLGCLPDSFALEWSIGRGYPVADPCGDDLPCHQTGYRRSSKVLIWEPSYAGTTPGGLPSLCGPSRSRKATMADVARPPLSILPDSAGPAGAISARDYSLRRLAFFKIDCLDYRAHRVDRCLSRLAAVGCIHC